MSDVSAAAPRMVKQAIQVIKVTHALERGAFRARHGRTRRRFTCFVLFLQSIRTVQKQAEGLCEILNMKSSQATLEIHRDVFGVDSQSDPRLPPARGAEGSRQPIRRAVEEASAAQGYVPLVEKCVD